MSNSKHDLWVGLFVMMGGAALLFLALKAGNLLSLNFDEGYVVSAKFDNIGGLKPRAAVKSAGVVIGRVESISFDDKSFQARVSLRLNQGVLFPKDSSAKILTSGLLGEQYIGLEPGAEEKNLAPNDVIKQTQSAVVLENLIGQFLYNKAAEPAGDKP
ncbi:phospholipid/cholesterol/gamma-HCH transport system substrate-binding protein [Inhella inkyongensis]|uniref:Phospholipid/cholesterol/gamma-HCH transport system substrate-binding protein n=1 Tax=Inhella inkyongensis TaxID=392593 RepID=A0A840RZA3_9BURK|nr:outer membrane lipid asymmetry maintenance protein MlaD [Inhella inkyongensis]MBB5203315.1 phospholipid/cholesterol/gamma-HCH transport system substrate-binding protein [Inhella inkyongensis]